MEYFQQYQQTEMPEASVTAAFQCEPVSPKGTQEGGEYLRPVAVVRLLTLWDRRDCGTPGSSVLHCLSESAQILVC